MRSRCIALLAVAACGDNDGYRYDDLVEVSGTTPWGIALNNNCGGTPDANAGEFRRLASHAANVDPAARPAAGMSNSRHKAQC